MTVTRRTPCRGCGKERVCVTYYSRVDGVEAWFFAQEASCKTLAKPRRLVFEAAPPIEVVVGGSGSAAGVLYMSTALRVGGVAALALVPVAVVLTVWLLRQG